ncbi:indole-3-glycerol phosphate synthase [Pedobacter psychrophilus]|uniref:Indole-3-glycerol phosphate synthase n=1 Tax=Pedobacter psychrophilus TaxID=1826909 RepID=A0A179DEB7_9SPHI|nr:indole-3-glycerol phosphate synthase TrpC [Pedobacter psychrophilus]OAQ39050.1 indole-3-glycerol phosphate synthase [Pedobacter psychrophilus]
MNILDKIVARKKEEVASAKAIKTIKDLERSLGFNRRTYALKDFLTDPSKSGIIAEFKRKSPSKGIINDKLSVEEVTKGYSAAGASALSVLTDHDFFMGKDDDLIAARAVNSIPILRKDFMVDEYQIIEAKALGADIILLIAACLTPEEILSFAKLAKSLGLSTLLEVHNREELDRSLNPYLDVIGVNNRNLKDFTVDIETSLSLAEIIPSEFLKISESAISNPETIKMLKKVGYNGFLIGENFMKTSNPGKAMADFVKEI